jgi:F-type H+-transporting ATPase subunit gamma
VTELLKQAQYSPLPISLMAASLFAVNKGYLDDIDVKKVLAFEHGLHQHLKSSHAALLAKLENDKAMDKAAEEELTAPSRRSRSPSPEPRRDDASGLRRSRHGGRQRDPRQDQELREHEEDHQGHGNGLGVEDAQGAGAHAPARPYADKIRNITAQPVAGQPRVPARPTCARAARARSVGFIVVTTDKGLCGGLNTNVLRAVTNKMRDVQAAGGTRRWPSATRASASSTASARNVVSHATQLGDAPQLDKLIGPVKVMLDAFVEGKLDAVYLCYTKFINTMKQEPVVEQLLPLSAERLAQTAAEKAQYGWDYIYEPDAPSVIDELLTRYIEALVYQAVAENMASEQSARMVAMKAATDNAGNLIAELKLVYNKTRQAAITKELSEIVGGAAAISG